MAIKQQKEKKKTKRIALLAEDKMSSAEKFNFFILRLFKVPLKEKLFFARHLGVMLKAGIPLLMSLKTLSSQTKNKLFSLVLKDVAVRVERGSTLTDSLRPHIKTFGELFINMIEAGELSGKLEDVLDRLFLQMKKQHELVSKVKGAMTYPAVIIVAMIGISTFMMVFVVPKIIGIFKEYSAELPLPTKILIFVSEIIINNGQLVGLGLAVIILILVRALQTKRGKYLFQAIILKTPIISPIVKKINLARFARTVSSLLQTDIMIIKTFQITANVLGNLHYREALLEAGENIRKGSMINDAIKKHPDLFPPVITQMVTVGEQTGELDNILQELADFYEDEVDKIMENLPSIIEPILILILGLGVGLMAAAIIMPMYSLTSTI